MVTCSTCGKEFEKATALRGHAMHHRSAKKGDIQEVSFGISSPTDSPAGIIEKVTQQHDDSAKFQKYKELPPPILEHLEKTYGNWLNFMEIGQVWRKDFGGYALYIKVPRHFSTEWKTGVTQVYDNTTRKVIEEKKVEVPDERWISMRDLSKTITFLDMVKKNIITNAYRAGLHLPNTNTGFEQTAETLRDYERSVAGISS